MKSQIFLLLIAASAFAQQQTRSISSSTSRRNRFSAGKPQAINFNCPEDFGYYSHPDDCSQYYVCVFGGALLESCTGGLQYSTDLQTCDWPRNVVCNRRGGSEISTIQITDPRTQSRSTNKIHSATESLSAPSSLLSRGVDNNIRSRQPVKTSGTSKSIFDDSKIRQGRFITNEDHQRIDNGFQAQETSSRSFNVVPAAPTPKAGLSFSSSIPITNTNRFSQVRVPAPQTEKPFYSDLLNLTDSDYYYYYDDILYDDYYEPTAPKTTTTTQAPRRSVVRTPSRLETNRHLLQTPSTDTVSTDSFNHTSTESQPINEINTFFSTPATVTSQQTAFSIPQNTFRNSMPHITDSPSSSLKPTASSFSESNFSSTELTDDINRDNEIPNTKAHTLRDNPVKIDSKHQKEQNRQGGNQVSQPISSVGFHEINLGAASSKVILPRDFPEARKSKSVQNTKTVQKNSRKLLSATSLSAVTSRGRTAAKPKLRARGPNRRDSSLLGRGAYLDTRVRSPLNQRTFSSIRLDLKGLPTEESLNQRKNTPLPRILSASSLIPRTVHSRTPNIQFSRTPKPSAFKLPPEARKTQLRESNARIIIPPVPTRITVRDQPFHGSERINNAPEPWNQNSRLSHQNLAITPKKAIGLPVPHADNMRDSENSSHRKIRPKTISVPNSKNRHLHSPKRVKSSFPEKPRFPWDSHQSGSIAQNWNINYSEQPFVQRNNAEHEITSPLFNTIVNTESLERTDNKLSTSERTASSTRNKNRASAIAVQDNRPRQISSHIISARRQQSTSNRIKRPTPTAFPQIRSNRRTLSPITSSNNQPQRKLRVSQSSFPRNTNDNQNLSSRTVVSRKTTGSDISLSPSRSDISLSRSLLRKTNIMSSRSSVPSKTESKHELTQQKRVHDNRQRILSFLRNSDSETELSIPQRSINADQEKSLPNINNRSEEHVIQNDKNSNPKLGLLVGTSNISSSHSRRDDKTKTVSLDNSDLSPVNLASSIPKESFTKSSTIASLSSKTKTTTPSIFDFPSDTDLLDRPEETRNLVEPSELVQSNKNSTEKEASSFVKAKALDRSNNKQTILLSDSSKRSNPLPLTQRPSIRRPIIPFPSRFPSSSARASLGATLRNDIPKRTVPSSDIKNTPKDTSPTITFSQQRSISSSSVTNNKNLHFNRNTIENNTSLTTTPKSVSKPVFTPRRASILLESTRNNPATPKFPERKDMNETSSNPSHETGLDRGSSRQKPKATKAAPVSGGSPQLIGRTPQRLVRPSKKPLPASSRPKLITDIWKYPPRRPTPLYPQPQPDLQAALCDVNICKLPDCSCGGAAVPGNIAPQNVPQMVLLTFDDSVNDLNKKLYVDLFERGRVNPNGCPIAATFYVSHEWTDYSQVQNLYSDGHEIASHSITHSFGEKFSTKKWAQEIGGQREIMSAYGGVRMEDIRGMRAPFLAVGGNNMFRMLYDLNFTYDSSMPVYENNPPSWPYTLDYKIFHDCMIAPCPTKSYPGVWQVPMVMWQDLAGGRCSMADACTTPSTAEDVYKLLTKNFERHYTTNRAPFTLFYHAAWFTTPHHKEGFIAFLDTISAMDDVWIVTNWQTLQWVRNPVPLQQAKSFAPFQCDYPERPPRCTSPRVCNVWHKGSVRYLKTCYTCPETYPWTGNTGVQSPLNNL